MPTVEQNLVAWDQRYPWPHRGEEWSRVWGGSEAQWFFVIYPRIHLFLPAGTVLEIAPGFGRWTEFLKDHCQRLIGVDLSSSCVEACRQRFASLAGASFHVNDGYSLAAVPDGSVDFVFSFDSLVHAEDDVVVAYLGQLPRVLAAGGVAFLHHSNMGAHRDPRTGEFPAGLERRHWRAESVSAKSVAEHCSRAGLCCMSQELVNWGVGHLSDCFSVVTRATSPRARERVLLENPDFMREARHVARVSHLYVRQFARAGKDAGGEGVSDNG